MPTKLYIVRGSHPCVTVERALQLKGHPYEVTEWLPPTHAPAQRLLFGKRTVPGIRFDDGEKVQGSVAILERLEQRFPEPPLVPADPALAERVHDAERWGDEVLQPIPRRLVWWSLSRRPSAIPSYQAGSKLAMPPLLTAFVAPAIVPIQRRLNRVSDESTHADLRDLPGHLDRIDGWLADGTLGGSREHVADLQIAPSLRLLMTIEDLRGPFLERPAGQWAQRLFPEWGGTVPAGTIPAAWLEPLRG
ncbi:MAG: glutathione S-transferase family protein [Patulibacter sp.]